MARRPRKETIDEIPPGASAEKMLNVSFPSPGKHQIAVHLDADAVSADNHRYMVIDLPQEVPALLIDGEVSLCGRTTPP